MLHCSMHHDQLPPSGSGSGTVPPLCGWVGMEQRQKLPTWYLPTPPHQPVLNYHAWEPDRIHNLQLSMSTNKPWLCSCIKVYPQSRPYSLLCFFFLIRWTWYIPPSSIPYVAILIPFPKLRAYSEVLDGGPSSMICCYTTPPKPNRW